MWPLPAMAPRVANTTDSTVADKHQRPAPPCRWSPSCAPSPPAGRPRCGGRRARPSGTSGASMRAHLREIRRVVLVDGDDDRAAAPAVRRCSGRCRARARAAAPSLRGRRSCASRTPAKAAGDARCAVSSAASMSSPSAGLIWIVASREIWLSQTAAVSRTSVTAPSVRQERKVMMAMTSTSARPATFCAGTIGAARALRARHGSRSWRRVGGAVLRLGRRQS